MTKREWDKIKLIDLYRYFDTPQMTVECDVCKHKLYYHWANSEVQYWGDKMINPDDEVGIGKCGLWSCECKSFSSFTSEVSKVREGLLNDQT